MIDSDYTGEAGFGEANQRAMPHANRLRLSAAANLWEPPTIFLSGFPHAWAAIVSTVRRVRNGEKVRDFTSLFSTTGNQVWISSFLRSRGYRLLSPCHHLTIEHATLQSSEATLPTFDLKAYARRGAEARIAELTTELNEIYRAFPDLRRDSARSAPATTGARGRRRRRKPMSAAQKAAVSKRMKAYWAARRGGKKGR